MAHRRGTNNAIRRRQGIRSQQQHAFVVLLLSLVISQQRASGTAPTYYPTYYPTYLPSAAKNDTVFAAEIDAKTDGGGVRTTTDENGALPYNESTESSSSQESPLTGHDSVPAAANIAADPLREVAIALAAAAVAATVLFV